MSWKTRLAKFTQKYGDDALDRLGDAKDAYEYAVGIHGLIDEHIPTLAELITDTLSPNTLTAQEREKVVGLLSKYDIEVAVSKKTTEAELVEMLQSRLSTLTDQQQRNFVTQLRLILDTF
jgi:hypothetical protein